MLVHKGRGNGQKPTLSGIQKIEIFGVLRFNDGYQDSEGFPRNEGNTFALRDVGGIPPDAIAAFRLDQRIQPRFAASDCADLRVLGHEAPAAHPPKRQLSRAQTCSHAPLLLGVSRSPIFVLIRCTLFFEGLAPRYQRPSLRKWRGPRV